MNPDFHTDYYTENYDDTEEEGQQYGDLIGVYLFSQESLNPPQENSTSDLDDAFQNCHGKSDDRRQARCKRLERKNLELFRVLKKSEAQLGLAKQDCMDIN